MGALGGWQQVSVSGNYPEGFLPLKDMVEETVENYGSLPRQDGAAMREDTGSSLSPKGVLVRGQTRV